MIFIDHAQLYNVICLLFAVQKTTEYHIKLDKNPKTKDMLMHI